MQGNTFGRVFRVTAAGESYGPALQIIVDGVPPGVPITEAEVQVKLDRRRPGQSAITSPRQEKGREMALFYFCATKTFLPVTFASLIFKNTVYY